MVPNGNIPMEDTLFADMVGPYAEAPDDWKHVMMDGANGMHTYDKTARLRTQLHNTEIEECAFVLPSISGGSSNTTPALFISELC